MNAWSLTVGERGESAVKGKKELGREKRRVSRETAWLKRLGEGTVKQTRTESGVRSLSCHQLIKYNN